MVTKITSIFHIIVKGLSLLGFDVKKFVFDSQCCGAGPFLTGSEFFFSPAPVPAPAPIKKKAFNH